jgi:hypothetical protein
MSNKAYNITVTPVATAERKKTSTGKDMIKFRASLEVRGRTVERTVIAQGNAAAQMKGLVRKGRAVAVRALFERAPANDAGKGGEYLAIVGLPRAKAAAAA